MSIALAAKTQPATSTRLSQVDEFAASHGLTAARIVDLAHGAIGIGPAETGIAGAVRDGYCYGSGIANRPRGAGTPAAFDVGMVVAAGEAGRAIARRQRPWPRPRKSTIAVASLGKGRFVSNVPGAQGSAAAVATAIAASTSPTQTTRLIVDQRSTLTALTEAAKALTNSTTKLGVLSWWADQAEIGSGWFVAATRVAADHFCVPGPLPRNATEWATAITGTAPDGPIAAIFGIERAVLGLGNEDNRAPKITYQIDQYAQQNFAAAWDRPRPFAAAPDREAVLYRTAETTQGALTSEAIAHDRGVQRRAVWEGRVLPCEVVAAESARRGGALVVEVHTPSRYRVGHRLKSPQVTSTRRRWERNANGKKTGHFEETTVRNSLTVTGITPSDDGCRITLSHAPKHVPVGVGDLFWLLPEPRVWSQDERMLDHSIRNLTAYTWLRDPAEHGPQPTRPLPLYVVAAAAGS